MNRPYDRGAEESPDQPAMPTQTELEAVFEADKAHLAAGCSREYPPQARLHVGDGTTSDLIPLFFHIEFWSVGMPQL